VAGATEIFDRLPSTFTLKVYIPSPKQSPTNIQITDVHMHARMQTHAYKRADARKSHNTASCYKMHTPTCTAPAHICMHTRRFGLHVFLFIFHRVGMRYSFFLNLKTRNETPNQGTQSCTVLRAVLHTQAFAFTYSHVYTCTLRINIANKHTNHEHVVDSPSFSLSLHTQNKFLCIWQ